VNNPVILLDEVLKLTLKAEDGHPNKNIKTWCLEEIFWLVVWNMAFIFYKIRDAILPID
jgi:hypothetical protein